MLSPLQRHIIRRNSARSGRNSERLPKRSSLVSTTSCTLRQREVGLGPRPRGSGLLLVALDFRLLLLGQADVVEAIEHAVLAVRVDFEMNDAAVGAANFLFLQIDRQRRVR